MGDIIGYSRFDVPDPRYEPERLSGSYSIYPHMYDNGKWFLEHDETGIIISFPSKNAAETYAEDYWEKGS